MRARRPVCILPVLLFVFAPLLATTACAPPEPAETEEGADATSAEADPIVDTYLDRYFAFYPSRATAAGLHTHDRELEDLTPERLDAWVAFNRETVRRLEEAARGEDRGGSEGRDDGLTPAERRDRRFNRKLDRELLLRQAKRELFSYETVNEPRTDPLFWTGIASNANVFLLVRQDLPAGDRLAAAAARAALLPRLVRQARETLGAADPSTVSAEHARIASGQASASAAFYRQGFAAAADDQAPDDDELAASMKQAAAAAADAMDALAGDLEVLAGHAGGSPRLGKERYAELFRLVDGVDEPVEQVRARAERALVEKRQETAAYGRQVWSRIFPDEAPPADDVALIRRLFDRVSQDRATSSEELVADFRTLVDKAFAFTREHDVITLPDPRTLWVGPSPSFFVGQSVGGVYPAGPYAPEADTLFYLPTPSDDATPEQKDAFFRDFNHHFNVMITPHEMVPGHYTQLKIAARQPHKVRSLFADGVYTEGWGTFCERLMLDQGWGGPLDRLAHLKKQLENIARTIVDIRVHTDGMERDEVLRFVKDEALQDDQFARNMWVRSITSAPQITSYWLGYDQIMGLYRDVREARGDGFVLRDFMDAATAMGPVPVRHYREAMLDG